MIEILKRYNSLALPVKATMWFTVCSFLQRGVSMVTTPLFTRLLPVEEYGITSTFIAWEMLLFMITSLSLHKSLMNLYVKDTGKHSEQILSAVTFLTVIITSVWVVFYFVFREKFATIMKLPELLCGCLFVSFVFNAIIQCWTIHKRYVFDYKKVVVVSFSMTFFSAFIGILCVFYGERTAYSKIIPYTIVLAVIGIFLFVSICLNGRTIYDKNVWKFSLTFCIPLLPHYLSEFVLQSSDKLMINHMCGARDVAIYSVAYSVGGILSLVTSAVDASFAPYEYVAIKKGKFQELSEATSDIILLVAFFIVGIMFMREEIVWVFGGKEYKESEELIIPICIGLFFNYEFRLFARVQEYYEKKKTIVIPSILAAILNIILNLVFVSRYGYVAAAYTTLFCYCVFCFVHYLFYTKVCMEENNGIFLYNAKKLLLISIGVVFAGVFIRVAIVNWIIKGLVFAVVIGMSMLYRKRIYEFLVRFMRAISI